MWVWGVFFFARGKIVWVEPVASYSKGLELRPEEEKALLLYYIQLAYLTVNLPR